MGENSKIEWTDHTFNAWRGCEEDSPGCDHCYAKSMAKRNPRVLGAWGADGTRVVAAEKYWALPKKWNAQARAEGVRRRVFCQSLGDVFEDWRGPMTDSQGRQLFVDGESWFAPGRDEIAMSAPLTMDLVRERLFNLIFECRDLDWLLLTKRPDRAIQFFGGDSGMGVGILESELAHVWIGTSVENQAAADKRIPPLLELPATVRFLSCEPLLGPIELDEWLTPAADCNRCVGPCCCSAGIDWVIVGGESGDHARPMHPDWARSLRDQCRDADVPYFFKQWGEWFPSSQFDLDAATPKLTGREERYVGQDGRVIRTSSPFEHGCPVDAPPGFASVVHVGKQAAGRCLDGREWSEFPHASYV